MPSDGVKMAAAAAAGGAAGRSAVGLLPPLLVSGTVKSLKLLGFGTNGAISNIYAARCGEQLGQLRVMALAAAAGGAAGAVALTQGLHAVGFGTVGVAAGSIAAGVHSSIGNAVAGSAFSALQAYGAAGVSVLATPPGITAILVGGVGGAAIVTARQRRCRL